MGELAARHASNDNARRDPVAAMLHALLAGGGVSVKSGFVYGASERWRLYAENTVAPDDLAATSDTNCSHRSATEVHDTSKRPCHHQRKAGDGCDFCGA